MSRGTLAHLSSCQHKHPKHVCRTYQGLYLSLALTGYFTLTKTPTVTWFERGSHLILDNLLRSQEPPLIIIYMGGFLPPGMTTFTQHNHSQELSLFTTEWNVKQQLFLDQYTFQYWSVTGFSVRVLVSFSGANIEQLLSFR